MKKISILIIIVLSFSMMFGCGGDNGEGGSGGSGGTGGGIVSGDLTEEQIYDAVSYSFASVFMGAMTAAFGQPPPGVTMENDGKKLIFKDFSLDSIGQGKDMAEETGYESLSGTFVSNDDKAEIDVTLKGGPVKTLKYTIDEKVMQGQAEKVNISVVANGKQYNFLFNPAM